MNWIKQNNIQNLVDIGSGEGFLGSILPDSINYIGIEPSETLVSIAMEQYIQNNLKYKVGSAYNTSLPDGSVGAVISVMVWFHLADLDKSAKELFRNLKHGGKFLIITSNPDARKIWESFFSELKIDSDIMIGKFETEDYVFEESIIYMHQKKKILDSLKRAGLRIEKDENIGIAEKDDDKLFYAITGIKAWSINSNY